MQSAICSELKANFKVCYFVNNNSSVKILTSPLKSKKYAKLFKVNASNTYFMEQDSSKTRKSLNDGSQNISEKEDRLISEEICRLLQFSFNHRKLREEILHSALEIIPANAPSTIFAARRSYNTSKNTNYSERHFDFYHQKLSVDADFAEIVKKDIENHIVSINALIEADFHRMFFPTGVSDLRGLYDLTRLLNRQSLRQIARASLQTIKVNDIVFGWMRLSLNEVWIIALRRYSDMPKFNSHTYELLKTFVNRLYDFRNAWNKQDITRKYLDVLTNREQEAIYHFIGGFKDKETATQMNISKRTLDSHWQNIFNKIGVSDKILVLDKLGMITNKIPLESEKSVKTI